MEYVVESTQDSMNNGESYQKRTITDARRVQNRVASKAYRQRKKESTERLKLLKDRGKGCSARYHKIRPRPSSIVEKCISVTTSKGSAPLGSATPKGGVITSLTSDVPQAFPSYGSIENHKSLQEKRLNHGQLMAFPLVFGVENSLDVHFMKIGTHLIGSVVHANIDQNNGHHKSALSGVSVDDNISMSLLAPTWNNNSLDRRLLGDVSSNSSVSQWPMSCNPKSCSKCSDSPWPHRGEPPSNQLFNREIGLDIASFTPQLVFYCPIHSDPQNAAIPLPLDNLFPAYLKPTRMSNFTAYAQIATMLGITLANLTSKTPASPFHQLTTLFDDPVTLITAAAIPSLSPNHHLQPTLSQIIISHHAYFDILPFPILRERGITMSATKMNNSMELKKDILGGGLICWDLGRGDTNQACDLRNWEVAPWFWTKWRILFDDDYNEIWRQSSRWWRLGGLG